MLNESLFNQHQPTSRATTMPLQCWNPSCFTAKWSFEMRLGLQNLNVQSCSVKKNILLFDDASRRSKFMNRPNLNWLTILNSSWFVNWRRNSLADKTIKTIEFRVSAASDTSNLNFLKSFSDGLKSLNGSNTPNFREIWLPEVIDQYSPPLIAGFKLGACKMHRLRAHRDCIEARARAAVY